MAGSSPPNDLVRLHRRVAMTGLCSRRAAEEWIRQGRVRVNGEVVTEMGVKVGPQDEVEVDGESVSIPRATVVLMNKPKGYVTTMADPRGRPTVRQLLPQSLRNLKPVGRLDMDTEGLLLFTNDGALAHRLAHPRYELDKEYEAIVAGHPSEADLQRLRKGIRLEDGLTAPAQIDVVQTKDDSTRIRIIIHEGRNRQIRRMFEAIGCPVVELKRTRVGFLTVRKLPRSACRVLGQVEIERLRRLVGLK